MSALYPGTNYPVFTLNELKTITSPVYVLVLVNDATEKKYACVLGTDISDYPEWANQFEVNIVSPANHLLSQLALNLHGEYDYYVFEMNNSSEFDFDALETFDPKTYDGLVERGIARYITPGEDLKYFKNKRESIKAYHG